MAVADLAVPGSSLLVLISGHSRAIHIPARYSAKMSDDEDFFISDDELFFSIEEPEDSLVSNVSRFFLF
jgi:hypothetical protein